MRDDICKKPVAKILSDRADVDMTTPLREQVPVGACLGGASIRGPEHRDTGATLYASKSYWYYNDNPGR